MNIEKKVHKIRPAARHILTIGRDLIKDSCAALIELVKNAYDADAENVVISFAAFRNQSGEWNTLKIVVTDSGHGMTYDTVINKWMIPSTADKLVRKYSPGKNRLMQGRKGIGRYATSILGNEMWLETIDENKQKTQLFINWEDFNSTPSLPEARNKNSSSVETFLDEIEIPIETFSAPGEKTGTTIEIKGNKNYLSEWDKDNIDYFIKELRKIVSPIKGSLTNDRFDIQVIFFDFPVQDYQNQTIAIEPVPIFELFDYRLSGTIKKEKIKDLNINDFIQTHKYANARARAVKNGNDSLLVAKLKFENKRTTGIRDEIFSEVIEEDRYCGKLELDIRVFDREAEAIENLRIKATTSSLKSEWGKRDIKKILDDMCGVSIYRGDFPVRPYGDPGYDWLLLDKRRVQDPSRRIGSNQLIGIVQIEAEELSHLEEKSARDGLKENAYYLTLKEIITEQIKILEERRFSYREQTGASRKPLKIEAELNHIFDLKSVENKIIKTLQISGIDQKAENDIRDLFSETADNFNQVVGRIREVITRYEGHITLGKIIMVLMHEGRKPLAALKNHMSSFFRYSELIVDQDSLNELLPILKNITNDLLIEVDFLVRLFDRLNPLAVKKRNQKKFRLKSLFERIMRIFENELKINNIELSLDIEDNLEFLGWEEDFYMIVANLIENSLYWLQQSYKDEKFIRIIASHTTEKLKITFWDNGPGIEKQYIETGKIFEPGFSTKTNGTGLGLSIAGEATARNNGELSAIYCSDGAKLIAQFNLMKGESE